MSQHRSNIVAVERGVDVCELFSDGVFDGFADDCF
jgi:hypothetical protein